MQALPFLDSPIETPEPATLAKYNKTAKKFLAEYKREDWCKYAGQAIERSKAMHKAPCEGAVYDKPRAAHICWFVERYGLHCKGRFTGQRIKLEPFQIWLLGEIYGWRINDDAPYYRRVYLEMTRKNGKSLIFGAITALYDLCTNPEGPEVAIVSASKMTATGQGHQFIRYMVEHEKNADLAMACGLSYQYREGDIKSDWNNGLIKALAQNVDRAEGFNFSTVLIDEYHTHPTDGMLSVCELSQSSRTNPQTLIVTTAGEDTSCPCYDERETVIQILSGEHSNDRYFGIIFMLDDGIDWLDFTQYKKAIPMLDITVLSEAVKQQALNDAKSPARAARFRIKQLGRWENVNSPWFTLEEIEAWRKYSKIIKKEDVHAKKSWIGIDMSAVSDFTAICCVTEIKNKLYVRHEYFLPSAQIDSLELAERSANLRRNQPLYREWRDAGYINVCEGHRIDSKMVAAKLREWMVSTELQICIADPYGVEGVLQNLTEEERNAVVEVQPTSNEIGAQLESIPSKVHDGSFRNDGNPITAWMLGNTRVVVNDSGRIRIVKRDKSQGHGRYKMDGAIALALAMRGQDYAPSNQFGGLGVDEIIV